MKAIKITQIAFAPEDIDTIDKQLALASDLNLTPKDVMKNFGKCQDSGDSVNADYYNNTLRPIATFRSALVTHRSTVDPVLFEYGYLKSIFKKIALVYMNKFEQLIQSKQEIIEMQKTEKDSGIKMFLAQSIFYLDQQIKNLMDGLEKIKSLFAKSEDGRGGGYQFQENELNESNFALTDLESENLDINSVGGEIIEIMKSLNSKN